MHTRVTLLSCAADSAINYSLEITPTWAVATVCFILIVISILIEHLLHLLAEYFKKERKKSLIRALEKIKSELMLLGFTSLLLTVSEKPIANICIPKGVGETLLPCTSMTFNDAEEETKCAEKGKVSLLSRQGVRELQYLIFHVAVSHVISCILTFSLGMAKMRRWESWETQTRTSEYQFSYDPRRFQLTRQTSFGKRHLNYWSNNPILFWPVCLVRQLYKSVSKVDYFTLRHGFIMAHFTEGSNFDFQKYTKRALEEDFGLVVGTSWWIWIFSVLYILFNANGFHSHLWLPFIPLMVFLLVGTKLQGIITKMCLDSHDKSHVVRGTLLVRPSDHFFWFGWPKLLLYLMSFILFQNSFELAFFTWTWIRFGIRSCFHQATENIIIRVAMGVSVQFLCGYVTLPLYALVTQMGSTMNKAVFTENVIRGIKIWHDKAKKSMALRNPYTQRPSLETSLETSPSFSLDPSVSILVDRPLDAKHVDLSIMDEEKVSELQESENQQRKLGSFHGFDLQNRGKPSQF
ncbi:MLO-like protein 6 [Gastrolobium bilobum]|uniref:MLO-like protein 6 n=1 Tax=Gastrolobium bilobum TaxID=150636 RepID=UPI002AB1B30E|nr:MLO-like protein 6 [Gastrolobium bilobum]